MLLNKALPVPDSYCSLCYMIRVNMEVFSDVTSPHLPNSRAWRAAKYISVCLKCPSPLRSTSSTSPPLFFSWCFVWDRLHLVSRVFPLGTNHSLYHAEEYIDVSIWQQGLHVISSINTTWSAEKCSLFNTPRESQNQRAQDVSLWSPKRQFNF